MHIWGDEWFNKYGEELYAAEQFIYEYVKKWSGCTLVSKEKYGTLRYEWIFPPMSSRYNVYLPKWLVSCDYIDDGVKLKYYLGSKGKYQVYLWSWNRCWLYKKWYELGRWVFKQAIYKACIKFPNVKEEIMDDAKWFFEETL